MPRKALVIGSGPNGLSAAVVLAKAGLSVELHEASATIGGAAKSAELTLPGFVHDVGSAVHPLALASPFFSSLPLQCNWIQPPIPLAHPFDDGSAVVLHRDLGQTAAELQSDRDAWTSLFSPLVRDWEIYRHELLGPIGWTRHPLRMARIGVQAILSSASLIQAQFRSARARALFAGIAAHYPFLREPFSAGIGMVLAAAGHVVGWPIPEGGAGQITEALAKQFQAEGGVVKANSTVESLEREQGLVLADISPTALGRVAGNRFAASFRARLDSFRYGPGAFKVDWALSGPVPWRAKACSQAGTVHLGGSFEEIQASEDAAIGGLVSETPYVLFAQPTLFDPTRAPTGKHIAWAYCHVPSGSTVDMTARIERQVERFAPGFQELILARHTDAPVDLEKANANLVGGDVMGGRSDWRQVLFRPTWRRYATPDPKIWICSAASPPGPGVHGMCGFHSATRALRSL